LIGDASDVDVAWAIYLLEEATGWVWPPSVIAQQEEVLIHNLIEIRNFMDRMKQKSNG
jgi:hypothetical protein